MYDVWSNYSTFCTHFRKEEQWSHAEYVSKCGGIQSQQTCLCNIPLSFFFLNTELELENMSYCWTWLITLLYQRLLFSAIVNQISIGSCWKYLEKIQFTLSVFFLNPSQTLLHLQYTLFQIQCHSLLPSAFCIKNYWEKNRHKNFLVTDGYNFALYSVT